MMFNFPTYALVICTAYTASFEECGKTDAITASGRPAIQGRTIAADHLPFGTKVKIDGHIYVVEDRFGGDYDNKIDIYMENKQDAWDFGVQPKLVELIEED